MAAAYAALLSLSKIIHQILHPPPTHHFLIPTQQIERLQQLVSSFIDFLEKYSSHETQHLETRILGAAYKAEDVIESFVVGQIQAKYETLREIKSSAGCFPRKLPPFHDVLKEEATFKLIEEFVSIRVEADNISTRKGEEDAAPKTTTAASSSSSVLGGHNIMIGFDEHLNQIRTDLATDEVSLQIIPVVGMGGIGKTTLATHVYKDAYVVERFDFRAWVSVSPECNLQQIIEALLQQINSNIETKGSSADRLEDLLHKELFGRRYFVVLDDMWDIEAWCMLKFLLPNNHNGSRILVTTRQLKLAKEITSCKPYEIGFLNDESSWALMLEVFGKECFPDELVDIGKSIASKCGGLPLALVVIGRLLSKSEKTKAFWEYVELNVSAAANDENDEQCMKILRLSYSQLPIYLKPCFLYLAGFPKNVEIHASRLIRLWVAEGFIKPACGKTLEEVAEDYLSDLLDRYLVMIKTRGLVGRVKTCSIHDLIRDLCTKEVGREKFLCIPKLDDRTISSLVKGILFSAFCLGSSEVSLIKSERRVSIHKGIASEKACKVLRSAALNRSFLSFSKWESRRPVARRLNLQRVLDVVDFYSMEEILQQFNSSYTTCGIPWEELHVVSPTISLLWNLQTLVVPAHVSLPSEIWEMPQLRHLKMPEITLPEPPEDRGVGQSIIVLQHLQTLSTVKDFIFRDHVLERIPNLKKLGIYCDANIEAGYFRLSNLASLQKLESLILAYRGPWKDFVLPKSLKKLSLSYCQVHWNYMSVVGLLPNLEVLKLQTRAAKGQMWNLRADEFDRLKFLLIDGCEMETWVADDGGFPCLEHLHLVNMKMEDIPIEFAEIPTLQTINLNYCSRSLLASAEIISKERESFGYEDVRIQSFPSESPQLNHDTLVGLDDDAETLIKYITEDSKEMDVISIVGMPGLGKTTMAWRIYRDERIEYEFPILIWVYVSQDYNIRAVLLTILKKLTQQDMSRLEDHELAARVKEDLQNSKFLLFLDDIWSHEAWDRISAALPKKNGLGKVMITSRHVEVALRANPRRHPHKLRFFTQTESWELLQLLVFAKTGDCPSNLSVLGENIAKQCDGVPLAIVVIGGILLKKLTEFQSNVGEEWEKVSKSVSVHQFRNDVEKITESIIVLSYNKLPQDLRNCFVYLGVFPEDREIPTWKLVRLWIAEGFVKPKAEKSLEEVAEDNLKELVARNLVMVDKLSAAGEIKSCRVHDLIREFCIRQAAFDVMFQEVKFKEGKFYPSEISKSPRLCIHSYVVDFLRKKPKGRDVQSFLCFSKHSINLQTKDVTAILEAFESLRVLDVNPIKFPRFPSKITNLIHLRYIVLSGDTLYTLPEAVLKLWNLQTIMIDTKSRRLEIKADISKMMQLRHLKTKAAITVEEMKGKAENLQTLSRLSVNGRRWSDVINKSPNLKDLGIRGDLSTVLEAKCLEKLNLLRKLKLVHDVFPEVNSKKPLRCLPEPDRFPPNLKFLTLSYTCLDWSNMATLGELWNLETLKLKGNAFMGDTWNSDGRGFPALEYLLIDRTDLQFWSCSGDSFPNLKCLVLKNCEVLEEIPSVLERSLQVLSIERVTRSVVEFGRAIELKKREEQLQGRGERGGFKLIEH